MIATSDNLNGAKERLLNTREAARRLMREATTLRKWACLGTGPLRPVRVAGRLGWRESEVEALITGGAQ